MDSAMIGKIEKAKRYAQEQERVKFNQFTVTFKGNHDTYTVSYDEGRWGCGCHFFATRGVCVHTMTMERILGEMLRSAVPESQLTAAGTTRTTM